MKCVIKSCKSIRKNASSQDEIFHKIPKDKILRNKWLKAINRNPEKFSVNAAICCSRHFESHCYINSLLFKRSKILKKNAVPTLFLDDEETSWKEGEKIQVLIHQGCIHRGDRTQILRCLNPIPTIAEVATKFSPWLSTSLSTNW